MEASPAADRLSFRHRNTRHETVMMCDRRRDPNETVAPQRPTRHGAGPSRLFEDQPISSGELKGRTGLKTPTFGCYVKGIPTVRWSFSKSWPEWKALRTRFCRARRVQCSGRFRRFTRAT